ncbi:Putative peroxiredoxin [Marinomonas gallaica]|uniref:Glutathione-dependent peroxiredoxin n=1 Tax=Marinomonas gallaica TaxID=1806667 RepID=A0A1C3JPJ7_9GAMM|nr:peroxiredoxin [Marinomonas gallaica]SBT17151.1 Putative peroxiredoxin [Marinomonas gallaica]SBT19486.1 Putative peroxiredoxin [Marinomonas gallaica]
MSVQIGDVLPYGNFLVMSESGPQEIDVKTFFTDKKVIMFAVPGAFTPTCSAKHLPGFVEHYAAFKERGVDDVVCLSVNDVFVMDAWGKAHGADRIVMASDNLAEFTTALGLEVDVAKAKMGLRSRRYAMLVENGIIQQLWLEEPGVFGISAAENVLNQI